MISDRAEQLYSIAISLKKYDSRALIFSHKRTDLLDQLSEMQKTVYTIQREMLTESDSNSYSQDYFELAILMSEVLSDCVFALSKKHIHYRTSVQRKIYGFHNLPRAFLPVENKAKISPKEATEYFRSYLKPD